MKTRKLLSIVLAALMLMSVFPLTTASAYYSEQATLSFSDSGITETVSGSGYTISGTTLTIKSAGTYRVTGSCSEGSIVVGGSLSDVTLILDDLTLSSSATAPLVVKKASGVLLKLVGTSTLTDNEDASTEETNSDFEGAAIKVKTGSSLTVFGDGTLKAVGNAKNGIKGGVESALTVDGGTIIATAVNNGIGFDGSIVINAGTFDITSENDGIKAVPDEGDTTSAGTITINGGTFTINAQGDGIQAAEKLTVTNGSFNIKTFGGYNTSGFDKDTMSCKGIKASGNNDSEENPTNLIEISGGTFNLNTRDDAVHSDGSVTITGGTFVIYTGDDGVHADATLTLGTENGYERDPEITINASYEGLEGSVVNTYSGKFYVVASDDGINSAGGSTNGSDPGAGGNDTFRPGGNQGGFGPGGQGGFGPGGQGGFTPGGQQGQQTSNGSYSLNIYGGDFYVNCQGDGLDSNGALNLLGGTLTVLSMQGGGDNSPIDSDGSVTINGATIFAAGSQGMGLNLSSSQRYYSANTSRSANTVVNVSVNGSVVYSEKLVRNINYLLYSSPSMTTNSASISTASAVTACKSNAWAHSWNNGVVETAATATSSGVMKYTCTACGDVERKTIPATLTLTEYKEDEQTAPVNTTVYTASFVTDENATINVYYTQDYSAVSEQNATTAIARSSDTGESDGTGSGQINFAVVTADGYKVDSVTVEGSYNNLKDLSLTELIDNLYRITKVTSDLTITVKTAKVDGTEEEDKGYNVSFVTDENATINTYYTQDYSAASETNVNAAVSRNSTSGVPDSTGEGQVNFTVVPADGYEVDSVTVDGSYKNLKTPADTGTANTYRITKVASDLTITVTTKAAEQTATDAPTTEPVTETQATTTEPVTETQATTTEPVTETQAPTEATTSPATEAPTQAPTEASTQAPTSATEATTAGVGKGADIKTADSVIRKSTTEELKGSAYGKLTARATKTTKKAITLKWKKVSGATKYVVYANVCGTKNKFKKLTTVSSAKTALKVTKVAGKKLKSGTYYKFLIVAVNSKGKVISTSSTVHAATKGGKYTNVKAITTAAKNSKVTLAKAGKKFSLKAKTTLENKKLKLSTHRALRYESSNTKVATVNSKGVITAKKKGTCYIYVYAQNGVYKKIKVTVKK